MDDKNSLDSQQQDTIKEQFNESPPKTTSTTTSTSATTILKENKQHPSYPSSDDDDDDDDEDTFEDATDNDNVNHIIDKQSRMSLNDTTTKTDINENEMRTTTDQSLFVDNNILNDECPNKMNNVMAEVDDGDGDGDGDGDDDDDDEFHDVLIDEEYQKELEKEFSPEEIECNRLKAIEFKTLGNEQFKEEQYNESIQTYTNGLRVCPIEECKTERAILYGNRAAAFIKLDAKQKAIDDCTKALEFNEKYMKVLIRRAKLYEEMDKLDECLNDYKQMLTIDSNYTDAQYAVRRLEPIIAERNEKLKTEMLGKLKDLGNMILKPFGLSTNNFQMQQDPNSGSYSINFNQNK